MARSSVTGWSLRALAVLLPCLVSAGAGCGSDELGGSDIAVPLRVDINGLPESAHTLEPQVALKTPAGWRMGLGLGRLDLSRFPMRSQVFLDLLLPSDASGRDVAIALRVQDQADQLVALGSGRAEAYPGARAATATFEVHDSRDTTPMLVVAKPAAVSRRYDADLFLYGWGFDPQARVTLDGQPLQVDWRSPALLSISVPAGTLKGATATLTVTNPDQRADTRADLLTIQD